MVEHVYYILTGRKPLLPPKGIDDPLFAARNRAYREQRREIDRIAGRFSAAKFNLKQVIQRLDCVGLLPGRWPRNRRRRSLPPGGTGRSRADPHAVPRTGRAKSRRGLWAALGRLTEQTAMLYGGIDSREVTERATDPSGAMGAIQRILSNDVACKQTGRDFGRPKEERVLFPAIEHTVVPGKSLEEDQQIRAAIVYLHERILGRYDAADSAEVSRTFGLFAGIVADAAEQKGLERSERYHCRQTDPRPPEDTHYTIRAWRAVVTYLLRRQEFLYE
jgi:hypothetical protein